MARLARVVVPGVPHHVTQRGNRRQETFFSEDDYDAYLALLKERCDPPSQAESQSKGRNKYTVPGFPRISMWRRNMNPDNSFEQDARRRKAASTSSRIDGLGRPVSDAVVRIRCHQSASQGHSGQVELLKLVSDKNGIVKGTYDPASVAQDATLCVDVSRDGYFSCSMPGLSPEIELFRIFGAADFRRIATLEGETQIKELRELLAGEIDDSEGEPGEDTFVQEHKFRPALRALVRDPHVGTWAGRILARIGVPDDVRLFIDHAPLPKQERFGDRWACAIACALLEPVTEKEWAFLRSCAMNDYDDRWVDHAAIRTLKLIASPKSKQILEEVGQKNKRRADSVEAAIKYIESAPAPLSNEDIVVTCRKVAQAIAIGKYHGNELPLFNEAKNKALVDFKFIAGRDILTYTATLHKVDGKWRLRGVRETMQQYLGPE